MILSPKLAPELKQQEPEPEPSTRTYIAPSPAISFQHPQHKQYRPSTSTSPALNKAGRIKTSPATDKTHRNKINSALNMCTEEEHTTLNKINFDEEQQVKVFKVNKSTNSDYLIWFSRSILTAH